MHGFKDSLTSSVLRSRIVQEIREAGIEKKHSVQEEIDELKVLIGEKRILIASLKLMAANVGNLNSEGVIVEQENCGIGGGDTK